MSRSFFRLQEDSDTDSDRMSPAPDQPVHMDSGVTSNEGDAQDKGTPMTKTLSLRQKLSFRVCLLHVPVGVPVRVCARVCVCVCVTVSYAI